MIIIKECGLLSYRGVCFIPVLNEGRSISILYTGHGKKILFS